MAIYFQGLRTAGYKVSDLDAAKQWYTKALGVAPYFDQPFYVGFNVAGYELGLQPDGMPATDKTDNTVAYWGVANAADAFAELIKLGATPLEEPMDVGEGIVVAAVKDPWGNAFGVIYNPHFKL
jgi:lactoylglutathione lyase